TSRPRRRRPRRNGKGMPWGAMTKSRSECTEDAMDPTGPLLDEIIAHPEDDTPRQVYADWLDDHGQAERAEFIRPQAQLAKLRLEDGRRPDLEARELLLLRTHRKGWAGPLRQLCRRWEFRRGFVEGVEVDTAVFLKRMKELLRMAPVRDVCFVHAAG